MGVKMRKIKTLIRNPFFVVFRVLELSKLHLYRFNSDYFMKKYPAAMKLFTDIDSLMYWVETADIYKELFAERERFAFDSFEKASPFFDASNNKVIGKYKDEANGKPINDFVGQRPKMYSVLIDDKGSRTEKHTAKGIKSGASPEIRQQQYVDQLQRPAGNYLPNHRIGSTLYKIYSIEVDGNYWTTFENHDRDSFDNDFNIFPCLFIILLDEEARAVRFRLQALPVGRRHTHTNILATCRANHGGARCAS